MRILLLLPFVACAGCFFIGYDSSWGQQTAAQQHNAQAARPASLEPSHAPAAAGPQANAKHVFKVRVWATAQFAAQTMDWKHDTRELVDAANKVLLAAASTRLDIASIDSWESPPDQADLNKALEGLRKHDKGEDAAWVIGLVGSFPTFTSSYHHLGMGHLMGRHLVLRAAADLGEHEAAEAAFDQLKPDERLQLVAERRRHRSVSTLLHELGHTLGAVHEDGAGDFMGPTYSKAVHTFGPAASQVLAIGLAHRDDADQRPFGVDLLRYYEGATAPWVDKERTELVAELRKFTAGFGAPVPVAVGSVPSGPPSTSAPTTNAVVEPPAELASAQRPVWIKAHAAFRAGDWKLAWETGAPLFKAHPSVLPVQDLRCQLATKLGFDMPRVRAECAQLMKLSTGKD